mmetsp:Transcript_63026/g.181287  ORF Transcript_63026/g.181287 Transcript_63026/m.181287 type:complete len:219 (-) Transcript_63026:409-1065(-)
MAPPANYAAGSRRRLGLPRGTLRALMREMRGGKEGATRTLVGGGPLAMPAMGGAPTRSLLLGSGLRLALRLALRLRVSLLLLQQLLHHFLGHLFLSKLLLLFQSLLNLCALHLSLLHLLFVQLLFLGNLLFHLLLFLHPVQLHRLREDVLLPSWLDLLSFGHARVDLLADGLLRVAQRTPKPLGNQLRLPQLPIAWLVLLHLVQLADACHQPLHQRLL